MSDMTSYYKALCHVMGAGQKFFYCNCHVDKACCNNNNKKKKIKGEEKQVEVYKLLRLLLEERHVYTF